MKKQSRSKWQVLEGYGSVYAVGLNNVLFHCPIHTLPVSGGKHFDTAEMAEVSHDAFDQKEFKQFTEAIETQLGWKFGTDYRLASPNLSEYEIWYGEIVRELEEMLECTTSDAQGIADAQPFLLQQSWTKGLSATATANLFR